MLLAILTLVACTSSVEPSEPPPADSPREGVYAVAVQERGTWGPGTTWENCAPEESYWLVEREGDMVCAIRDRCLLWFDAFAYDVDTGFIPMIDHRCDYDAEHFETLDDGWARFAEGQLWIYVKGTKNFACRNTEAPYNDYTVSVIGIHTDD